MTNKRTRQSTICELISDQAIASQEQLVKKLSERGIETTQTTLSRDITELGIWKGPHGYALPSTDAPIGAMKEDLSRVIQTYMSSARVAGNLVVIKTPPGRAQPIGYELDRCKDPRIVGNISGDDTIFVATPSDDDAQDLMLHFKQIAGLA
jgi:transcriptional regulator of arginine metabolism